MSQQVKVKVCWTSVHNKNLKFSCDLCAPSAQFMCSLARFDLPNWGMRQPVQPHTFCVPLLVAYSTRH